MIREEVVLLTSEGEAAGSMAKAEVHHAATPLHLAFSCHVIDTDGRILLTRRAATKIAFPHVWTNAVCGHPGPGEDLVSAVRRRAMDELGLAIGDIRLVLPRFAYAAASGGVLEHELCPVVVAVVAPRSPMAPDLGEVSDHRWLTWDELLEAIEADPGAWSPWVRMQLALGGGDTHPRDWPTGDATELPAVLRR